MQDPQPLPTITLYNTLTRHKDPLQPLVAGQVSMYNCGLTVYSQPHIGNWSSYIYWDVLYRLLLADGYTVRRTQNITDVGHLVSDEDGGEDKMEKGARQEGMTAWRVAQKYADIAYDEAYSQLGLLAPGQTENGSTFQLAKATDYILEQIQFVQALEVQGLTYSIPQDGIYFDTSKLVDYGRLAQLDIAGLQAGNRVKAEGKRNLTDFALWKFSPLNTRRDMEWWAPWAPSDLHTVERHTVGRSRVDSEDMAPADSMDVVDGWWGFPGWHLECSVIARQTLGDQIDIHTGGIDHIPVHHPNEIAQTESVTGTQFVQLWAHANHLKSQGTKIAKSLGNGYSIGEVAAKGYDLQAFKLMMLSKHYRTEGNFTWEILDASANNLKNIRRITGRHLAATSLTAEDDDRTVAMTNDGLEAIRTHLRDDLDTPAALAILHSVLRQLALCAPSARTRQAVHDIATQISALLGIDIIDPTHSQELTHDQQALFDARQAAREAKDWAKSDELRGALVTMGIGVNDTKNGTEWYRL